MNTKQHKSRELQIRAEALTDAGQLEDACNLYLEICKLQPDNPEAWILLGRLQAATGKNNAALESCERAISLDPEFTGALLTKAHVLQSLERLPEAVEAYCLITAISPDRLSIHCATGRLLIQLNRWEDAEDTFSTALRLDPKSASAHEGLGTVYSNMGRLDPAEHHLRQAVQYGPALLDVRRSLATLLRNKGDTQGAIEQWSIIAAADQYDMPSRASLCLLHWELGEVPEALDGCLDILEKYPDNLALRQIFPMLLSDLPRREETLKRVRAEITRSFSADRLDYETLFKPSLRLLQQDPSLNLIFGSSVAVDIQRLEAEILSGHFTPLFNDELFLNILCNTTVSDVGLEVMLTRVRNVCLNIADREPVSQEGLYNPDYSFLASLACQCFQTEYSYAITSDQEDKLERLEQSLSSGRRETEKPESSDIFRLIVLAMYRPLHALEFIDRYIECLYEPGVMQLDLLIKRQLNDFRIEAEIRGNITRLTQIESSHSREIEGEYDDSPYPRWLSVGTYSPEPCRIFFRRKYPGFADSGVDPRPLRMLVAGCGTGRHAILAASQFEATEVLAVDLSLSSLAYGQRMAGEMGVNNITFQHADIMELDSSTHKFHVIEAGGVLHNMKSPAETIKLFSDLLEDKGLLHVSTYRKAARNKILMAREYIRKMARPKTPDGIRQARQDIVSLPDTNEGIKSMTTSRDFFTLSEARFLLFDVHEHTFEMDELYEMLETAGLRIIGFDLETPQDLHRYRLLNPDDLSVANQNKARAFEREYPFAFTSQYQFWCQKR